MKATAVVSSKSQITIPAWVRRQLGIKPGSRLAIRVEDERIVLEPAELDLDALRGSMRGMFGEDPDVYLRQIRAEGDREF